MHLIFPTFFPLDREVFGFFVLLYGEFFCLFFLFYLECSWDFLKELDIERSEHSETNISGGGASVIPNKALPHIGRQPRHNAKDDRYNLPALL